MEIMHLCARCGDHLRVWLSDGGRGDRVGMPGAEKVEHGLFEDHAEGEEIEGDELMADGRVIGLLPKHPLLTESRQDSERASKDGSSSPPVASTLPEEYRWSGLE